MTDCLTEERARVTVECRHPVMEIETGFCVDCGEPIDCPPILNFGTGSPR